MTKYQIRRAVQSARKALILCNKYRPPITSGTFDADIAVASKMTMLAKKTNELQQFVLENGLDKRSMKWASIDADSNIVKDFPRLAEEDIRELTIGVHRSNAGDESLGIRDWTEDVDDAARAIDSSEDEDALDNQGQEE
uniref:Uncharacterized protein n=1 Tax=Magallana gigas TaxID=29159 RepID=A0A8W8J067_MAGGI